MESSCFELEGNQMLTMRLAVSVDPGSREDGSLQMCGLIEANWPSGLNRAGLLASSSAPTKKWSSLYIGLLIAQLKGLSIFHGAPTMCQVPCQALGTHTGSLLLNEVTCMTWPSPASSIGSCTTTLLWGWSHTDLRAFARAAPGLGIFFLLLVSRLIFQVSDAFPGHLFWSRQP